MDNTTPADKQREVLNLISDAIAQNGRPPTYRDLAKALGVKAVGTIQDHVQALIKKGYLERDPHSARGLRLTHSAYKVDVPILGMVPAGSPLEAIEERIGSVAVSLPPSIVKRTSIGDLFALKVVGESMISAGILPGDLVIVRKQDHARDGQIVVAMIDGEATVKTFEKNGARVRLLPQNPDATRYRPIEINGELANSVQGVVIGVQRTYF
jgi:repressor LexA